MVLLTDGAANDYGQSVPPSGNDFNAIAAGLQHSIALKTDGSIVGWGLNDYNQASPPDGNDFVAIAAGFEHSIALKRDGSIVCWGEIIMVRSRRLMATTLWRYRPGDTIIWR